MTIKLNELEDVKFLHLIVKELLGQVDNNIEVFSCEKTVGTEEFVPIEDGVVGSESFTGKSVTLEVCWRPSNDVNHPFKHIDKCQIRWHPQCGTMSLELRYHSKGSGRTDGHSVIYPVGYPTQWHNEYLQVKKDYVVLFKKIYTWYSVEVPRRNREKLINAVCEAFPSILDELLVGDRGEKT